MKLAKIKKADAKVTLEQRKSKDRRGCEDRRTENIAAVAERRVGQRREKVNRRRQIDPTTCEREYTDDELQFMHALDLYKRSSGRMFPTCSEVLEVLRGLGYEKNANPTAPFVIETIVTEAAAIEQTDTLA